MFYFGFVDFSTDITRKVDFFTAAVRTQRRVVRVRTSFTRGGAVYVSSGEYVAPRRRRRR